MESTIESLSQSYNDFITAAAVVIESRATGESASNSPALETFKQKWELFRVACDQAEELIESVRQRIGSECLVDEATGGCTGGVTGGIQPISAVRLEQMSKAVRWLVIELQHGGGAHVQGLGPNQIEKGFNEDAAQ